MYVMGEFFRVGHVQDPDRAIIWYARAAEAGDSQAQERLAEMMTSGAGLPAREVDAAGRYWRLAADAGRRGSQMQLATLIRDGIVPFRPVASGRPDRGAAEIRQLYLAAFNRGNPRAGLELGRLYRTGFPKDAPSEAIPRSPERAARVLWDTIEMMRRLDLASPDADFKTEAWAAFELIAIYDTETASGAGRSTIITEDQIALLRREYGDGSKQHWIRAGALGPMKCGTDDLSTVWVLVWNWTRPEPPTEKQFDWIQRQRDCKDKEHRIAKTEGRKLPPDEQIGFTKKLRDVVLTEHKAALKESGTKTGKVRTFVDRIVERVNKSKS
ncbi:MAG: sel1 repeat family protein [Rhodospirillales bacterium]|nr:sel1 repeat family protein [Rhodospirillales bacterium]